MSKAKECPVRDKRYPVTLYVSIDELGELVREATSAAGSGLYHTAGLLMAVCWCLLSPEQQARWVLEEARMDEP